MDLTRAAIDRTRVTSVALLVIVAAGVSAYTAMPRAEDPGFVIRAAQVLTRFPGASPERVENLVTDPLEAVIQEIPELDFVSSTSKTGVSIIVVNIKERYTDMRPIWDNLRRKIDRARADLPDDVIGPTVNDEFGEVFGIIAGLTGEGFSYAELREIADRSRDELLRLPDVAKVDIYGAQDERVFVEYSNARLAEVGLSPVQLRQVLESANIIIPGGDISTGRERIVLEPSGNFESLEDLRRTVVTLPGRTELAYLEDLATIRRGYVDPPRSLMRTSDRPSLGLAVSMREGGNIIDLGAQVDGVLARLRDSFPIGVDFHVVAFQPALVDQKVREFGVNLLQAIGIVLLVMLGFLGLRTGLVVAALVPMAMIASLLVMSFLGIGLDQMSLAALIIALGMLVDNAIVMAESIMVQMQEGRPAREAALQSAHELRVPLLISSLTTAAAFLPIYLAESTTGEYTAPLFTVVTITLLCSWLLALTMTPLLSVLFLRVRATSGESARDSRVYAMYRRLLVRLLSHRWASLGAVGALFVVALTGLGLVPSVFFPPSDKAIFTVDLKLPSGTSIERTHEVARAVDGFIARRLAAGASRPEGVTGWATFVGQGGPRFYLAYNPEPPSPEYAFTIVNATSREVITRELIPALEAFCLEQFPDLETTLNPLQMGPPIEAPVQVRLSGRDPDALFRLVDGVKAELRHIPGTRNVDDDWGRRSKKLVVRVDQPRARRAGVTNQDVAVSLQAVLSGFETTEYREEDDVIPVTLRSVAADHQDLGKLETLNVFAQATGQSVPLLQVAAVDIAWEAGRVIRRNRLKTVTVEASLDPGVTASDVNAQLIPWLETQAAGWDFGYRYELGGEIETSVKANQSIGEKLPIAALIIVLLLVGQFNSIRRTAIILLTIPLGLVGVVAGLLLAGSYMGFMTLLGIIALAGIVINNAIVLIERIDLEIRENGLTPGAAIVEAAQRRLRPILLTTATTVAGLLPLWLGGGPMWEPMAIAIIFGLLFATVLTLGVVPILYAIMFRVRFDAGAA